ncbi:PREDICTED: metal transporter nramp1 homolog isoform X1 [Amphimedon queenslandica]|uniref:Uncharacterized protein n=2 Tax=Amphimedon queenslandica TaxID=400682 RepID=A0A1X7VDW6_AMPQE|nr:PREDICTED: metal transporter nramp1 homolog isoform X1 [Amphimedon queenslandica]|eukprot:XP_019849504.1 PREDICTED: metal transporter nramp1 homolog isoform X1 [Amphimedon queenslandica]
MLWALSSLYKQEEMSETEPPEYKERRLETISEQSPLLPSSNEQTKDEGGAEFMKSEEHKAKDFQLIHVPHREKYPIFSFRKLWAFTGPGFLMSIAYLDPGNIESDLQAGAAAQYKLLWVLLWSTVAGLLMQLLAARLGVVTGKHLAEVCKDEYPLVPRIVLWIAMELAIIGSDIQEVIGSAIAINILSQGTIPLWEGCLVTGVDTFLFLFLESYGLRYLEFFFGFLISIMCGMFGWMYVYSAPSQVDVLKGTFIPMCANCSSDVIQQGLGVVGAVIMPHNIYLHSGLVLSRAISRTNPNEVKEGIKYNTIESSIALLVSFVINLFVICVFGMKVFSYDFPSELKDSCSSSGISLLTAEECLYNSFGQKEWIKYIWAIGLLASGQSSTMTGTYAGQFVMEGFLGLKWAKWKRVLLTRSIAMVPCVILAILASKKLDLLDELINVEQSILLPFSVLPILFATSSKRIMKQHRNHIVLTVVSWVIAMVVLGVNIYFIIDTLDLSGPWYQHVLATLGLFIYICIVLFFIIFPIIREVRLWRKERRYGSLANGHSIND